MIVKLSFSGVKQTRWYEYLLRFVFGGLITAAAGLIAKFYGPAVGGLFLAFPSIFPASTTLIEKHERERKAKLCMNGTQRARLAVAADSAGAALGCLGLAGFGVCTWLLLPRHSVCFALPVAMIAWAMVSVAAWWVWKRL